MDIVQLCEIGMLVAFGFSWPFNIIKSWRSRTAKGKSVVFEFIVVFGYLIGLSGKIITYQRTGVWALFSQFSAGQKGFLSPLSQKHKQKSTSFDVLFCCFRFQPQSEKNYFFS